MDAFDVAGWEGYSIAMLGAVAALIGLIFVALSVNMQQVLRFPWLAGRAGESILYLVVVLAASSFILAPGQAIAVLGLELVLLGLVSVLYIDYMGLRRRSSIADEFRRMTDIQLVIGTVALGLFVVAGLSLMVGWGGGLYWIMPATLVCIGLALLNAWILLVEINR